MGGGGGAAAAAFFCFFCSLCFLIAAFALAKYCANPSGLLHCCALLAAAHFRFLSFSYLVGIFLLAFCHNVKVVNTMAWLIIAELIVAEE
jgi:hypothetical protein